MMNGMMLVALGVGGMVLQSTVLAYWGVGGLRIEVPLILITYIALHHPLRAGMVVSIALGYLYGMNSAAPFGLHMVSFSSLFVILYAVRERLYIQGDAFCIGLTAVMVVAHDLVVRFILASRGVDLPLGWNDWVLLVPKALFTGSLWPVFRSPMNAIDVHFPIAGMTTHKTPPLEMRYR